tara:strand:- start:3125 stop:3463 length:339 start_codon:yes stop_codon:yes gene_type:complete
MADTIGKDDINRIKELEGSLTDDNQSEIEAEIFQLDPDWHLGKYAKKSNKKTKKRVMAKHGGHGERIMRSMGSPSGGENAALMNATEDRAGTPFVSRGAGATLKGIKFKGVF